MKWEPGSPGFFYPNRAMIVAPAVMIRVPIRRKQDVLFPEQEPSVEHGEYARHPLDGDHVGGGDHGDGEVVAQYLPRKRMTPAPMPRTGLRVMVLREILRMAVRITANRGPIRA